MTVSANFALRAFYVVAGIALVVYALALSYSRGISAVFLPVIFGVLLVIQGVSGA